MSHRVAIEIEEFFKHIDMSMLQNNKHSRLHSLVENIELKKVLVSYVEENTPLVEKTTDFSDMGFPENAAVFLVNHDWDKFISGINPSDEEIRLPSDSCIFEFSFPNLYVIYWINSASEHFIFSYMWKLWSGAYSPVPHQFTIHKLLWSQIKALCVALDAEVAETEMIRAPTFLNRKRIKKGRTPLNDYHVVNLAKRHKIANPHGGHSGTKYRLHFRRGHWRHYEDHKTWVKWCLAGDADLGFVDKHYTM